MNKYIYILLAIVCAFFAAKIGIRTIDVTSHYMDESINREKIDEYSIIDKRVDHVQTKGSVTIEYMLTVAYADSVYKVEVPTNIYDEVTPGIGEKLEDGYFYYDKDNKSVKFPSENISVKTLITYWAFFAITLFLIAYFIYKAKKTPHQESR